MALAGVGTGAPIPGSHWGEPEAGLVGATLHVRADTPVHSALHETCHFVCMAPERRRSLHTDAGGDYDEESAVCYLSVLVAEHVELAGPSRERFGRARMLADMDAWGYTFRLGSARAWFDRDAADAHAWLLDRDLVDGRGHPTWRLRQGAR